MIKANRQQLETINKRYNDIREDIVVGFNYLDMGAEITDFEVDDNGRTTMRGYFQTINYQYAIRYRHFERHPRLKQDEINYLLGV